MNPAPVSILRCYLSSKRNSIVDIRPLQDYRIATMGYPIQIRLNLDTEMGHRAICDAVWFHTQNDQNKKRIFINCFTFYERNVLNVGPIYTFGCHSNAANFLQTTGNKHHIAMGVLCKSDHCCTYRLSLEAQLTAQVDRLSMFLRLSKF